MIDIMINCLIYVLVVVSLVVQMEKVRVKVNLMALAGSLQLAIIGISLLWINLMNVEIYRGEVYPVVSLIFYGIFKQYRELPMMARRFEKIYYFVLITQGGLALFSTVNFYLNRVAESRYEHLLFFNLAYFILLGVSRYFLRTLEEQIGQEELEARKASLEEDMVPIVNRVRMMQHEYAHLLSGFQYEEENSDVAAVESEQEIVESLGVKRSEMDLTYYPMIDNALMVKRNQLFTKGILMTVEVEGEALYNGFPAKEYEMVMLLVNLIDNARDALLEVEDKRGEEMRVDVKLIGTAYDLCIKVGNSHDTIDGKNLNLWMRNGYTSKNNGANYGMGLHIVRSFIRKYKGTIHVEEEGRLRYLVITL